MDLTKRAAFDAAKQLRDKTREDVVAYELDNGYWAYQLEREFHPTHMQEREYFFAEATP